MLKVKSYYLTIKIRVNKHSFSVHFKIINIAIVIIAFELRMNIDAFILIVYY
jgi:hypothetical protein